MVRDIRFFRKDGRWYADVPGHSLEDNEMVFGADAALETLSEGGNEVIITVSTEPDIRSLVHFKMKEHDSDGAWYQLVVMSYESEQIWICNVTHDVFGEHPEDLYILEIK